jgi:hypothetical protein
LESFIPIDTENKHITFPLQSLKTPPIPATPGLPGDEPSTFHLSTIVGLKADHVIEGLIFLTFVHLTYNPS